MFDTYVTIVGNCITPPERRRTTMSQSLVTSFKVASTARRLNRETGQWVDGNSLRVRVTCWRRLAESVAACVRLGDPVIVAGRLYTRDWVDEHQTHRVFYELDAVAVGHDLAKGHASFARVKQSVATSMVEDDDAGARTRDEHTERVPGDAADGAFEDYPASGYHPDPVDLAVAGPYGLSLDADEVVAADMVSAGPGDGQTDAASGVPSEPARSARAASGRRGDAEPDEDAEEGVDDPSPGGDEGADPEVGRRRRGRSRVPVSA